MIRRFFTRLLIILLLGICGYNWLEIHQLKAELASLRFRQSAADRKAAVPADWAVSTQRLEQSLESWKRTAQAPDTRRKLAALQKQTALLEQQADALWHKANTAAGHPAL